MATQRAMLYVGEDDAQGRQSLSGRAKKILASYANGLLVEAEEADLEALQGEGFSVAIQKDATMVKLRAVEFDTAQATPELPAALTLTRAQRARKRKRDYWIVQFVGPLKADWGEQIAALGARLQGYIPENAFLVQMPTDAADQVRALPFVNWVGPYEPAYKVSPLLMGRRRRATGEELATLSIQPDSFQPTPAGNLSVLLHSSTDRSKVVKAIQDLGGTVVAAEGDTITASLNLVAADHLAKMVEVKYLEPYQPSELHNDVASQIMAVQDVRDNHALDGEGQIVAVVDSGLDRGVNDNTMHADFRGRIVAIYDRAGDGANDVNSGHGTHVSGSVLGSGAASNGATRGMAPAARLVFQSIEQNSTGSLAGVPADYNQLFQQAYDDGARIHTNSWGNHLHGQYTAASQDIDEFMWNHKDSVILFSASNDGVDNNNDGVVDADSLSSQACAKNCITVGASENNRATGGYNPGGACDTYGTCWPFDFPTAPLHDDRLSNNSDGMVAFSGRGPTDDGRPKPDVVAPGTNILSVRSAVAVGPGNWGELPAADPNRASYWYMGGTSMSTPLTAGTVALIRQYLQRVCLHNSPSGALLKAILIHGATAITGQYVPSEVGAVPDNSQGWGRVDLRNALFSAYPVRWEFRDTPADAVGTGEQRDYTFPVVDTAVPLRATLAWTDFPSDPAGAIGLVNQLRLSVIAPNGTATQGLPANNNVQRVVIDTPQVGNYTVRVTGINVPTLATHGERQDFALVVSGGLDFVELYIKDNPADQGIPPSAGTLYQSPDIWVSLDNDPTLPPAGNPEYGQTNYVFVRVHNRGPKAANNATVKLYWAHAGTNLSRPYWKTDDIKVGGVTGNTQQISVAGRTAAGDGQAVTAAFEWQPPDPGSYTVQPGHFCLFATVTHPDDPLLQEDVDAVGWEDNLAWRNVDLQDMLPNTETTTEFYVAGEAGRSVKADLRIDRRELPPGGSVRLKVPGRWLVGATMDDLEKVWQSPGGRVCRVAVTSDQRAELQNISLEPGENTLVTLEVTLPQAAVHGELYPVYVDQKVDGQPRGRVTLLARTVGTPAYIANRNSGEIHLAYCAWVNKISPRNKVPYDDLALAIRRGYNGCRFCLPGQDTG